MVSARSNLVGRLGAFAGAGPRDFSVGFRAAVTDVDADAGVTRLEDGVAGVHWREIKLFPEAWVTMGNVVLAVFAEVAAIGIDDGGGVEVDAGHFDFVDRDNKNHLVFLSELLHGGDRRTARNPFGELVPAGFLLRAKIRALE